VSDDDDAGDCSDSDYDIDDTLVRNKLTCVIFQARSMTTAPMQRTVYVANILLISCRICWQRFYSVSVVFVLMSL